MAKAAVKTPPPAHQGFKPYKPKKSEEYMSEGQIAHFTENFGRLENRINV